VGDDGGLERDDRPPRVERGGDVVAEIEERLQYLTEQP
jgi:hypothetical protein